MSFAQQIDKHITQSKYIIPPNSPRTTFWPTEASFKGQDGVIGKCLRQAWYDHKGFKATNPVDAKGQATFDLGNMVEAWYIDKAKQIGIWAGDGIRYYDEKFNISAKMDLFILEDNRLTGVECKSFYGHYAEKEIKEGPKTDHLMQTSLYLDYMNRLYGDDRSYWSGRFYIEYFGRDTCLMYEHLVELTKGEKTYPIVNSIETQIFNVEGIAERYKELELYKGIEQEPPRDYTYAYSDEEVEAQYAQGKISKAKYAAWKKGTKTISDWRCVYCSHLDRCWPEKRKQILTGQVVEEEENG